MTMTDDNRMEVSEGASGSVSGEFASSSSEPGKMTESDGKGLSMEFGPGGASAETEAADPEENGDKPQDDPKNTGQEAGDDAEPASEDEPEGDPEEGDGEDPAADLGAWDSANDEVVSKFDGKFINEDESINFGAFSENLEANLAAGKTDLSPQVRAYAKERFGVSDEFLDQHVQGVIATRSANDAQFYGIVGDGLPTVEEQKGRYQQKLEWAKGVYSDSQKAKFNEALKAGGEAAMEQLELLNARYEKANPGSGKQRGGKVFRPGTKRPASPQKNATGGAATESGSAVKPYASLEEHRNAQAEAVRSGDPKKIEEVRKRLKASPKLWKGQ